MIFCEFTSEKIVSTTNSADFSTLIKTIQYINKNSIQTIRNDKNQSQDIDSFFQKVEEKKNIILQNLCQSLGYTLDEATQDIDQSLDSSSDLIIEKNFSIKHNIPQRLVAVYGHWSSPLYRFIKYVLPSLLQQSSVVLFCEPEASEIYCLFAEMISQTELGKNRIAVLPVDDPEVLSAILEHPSISSVIGQMNLFQAPLYRQRILSPDKTYNLHFGAHNPIIFLNDTQQAQVTTLLAQSLQYHTRAEVRFNRWFVQEKIYPELINWVEMYLNQNSKLHFGNIKVKSYSYHYEQQNKDLFKVKHWLRQNTVDEMNICSDFSNCSPLHQMELLGPLLTITRFKNGLEATKFANTTNHANATCIVTNSNEKFIELAQHQRTPVVFNNILPKKFDTSLDQGDRHCSLSTTTFPSYQLRTIVY